MLYIICPTCNRLLADKMIPYENGIKKIQDDVKLNDEQKYQEKIKLINSLGIPKDRYCCRMRLMTYRDLVRIVK
jgi:DNA-directed RNA polymerase subunit N (RpoN/RPB10)